MLGLLGPGGVGGWAWTLVPRSWQIEPFSSGNHALSPSGLASWHQLSVLRTSLPFPAQPGPALPLGTHYLPCLCQGLDSLAPTSGPSLSQGRGRRASLVPGAGSEQQRDLPASQIPLFTVPLLPALRASSPPTTTQVCGFIWGPRKGALSLRNTLFHCHGPGPVLQLFPQGGGCFHLGSKSRRETL